MPRTVRHEDDVLMALERASLRAGWDTFSQRLMLARFIAGWDGNSVLTVEVLDRFFARQAAEEDRMGLNQTDAPDEEDEDP